MRGGHPDVHDRNVRAVGANLQHQLLGVAGLAGDLEARLLEQPRDALAQEHRVIRQNNADALPVDRPDPPCLVHPQPGELSCETRRDDLEDPLGLRQSPELVGAEVLEVEAGVREELPRSLRDQHLAAVTGPREPGDEMDVEPVVAPLGEGRLPGVDAHAHPHVGSVRPLVGSECRLGVDSRGHRVPSLHEDERQLVAVAVDLASAAALGRLSDEEPVLGQGARVEVAEPVDEPRRALDVGEEQGDRSEREVAHLRRTESRLGRGFRHRAGSTPGVARRAPRRDRPGPGARIPPRDPLPRRRRRPPRRSRGRWHGRC